MLQKIGGLFTQEVAYLRRDNILEGLPRSLAFLSLCFKANVSAFDIDRE